MIIIDVQTHTKVVTYFRGIQMLNFVYQVQNSENRKITQTFDTQIVIYLKLKIIFRVNRTRKKCIRNILLSRQNFNTKASKTGENVHVLTLEIALVCKIQICRTEFV